LTRPARAAFVVLSLAACGGTQHARAGRPPLDPIVLPRVEGGELDTSELRGRVVVLFFFTTYSGPSQAVAPFVSQVAVRHAADELAVVGVALEPGSEPIVEAWRDFVGVRFPVVIADEQLVAGQSPLGRIPAVPSFAFLDRHGALVGWDVRLLRETELEEIVSALLR
jgi:thiol-disulfide isomerase/thioredoxin